MHATTVTAEPDVDALPLDQIDVSNPLLYLNHTAAPYSRGCGEKIRCITAPTASLGRTGQ